MDRRTKIYIKNKNRKSLVVFTGPEMPEEMKLDIQKSFDYYMKSNKKVACIFLDPQTSVKVIQL